MEIDNVELLPYHRLEITKYDQLDIPYLFRDIRIPNKIDVSAAKEILSKDLNVKVVH